MAQDSTHHGGTPARSRRHRVAVWTTRAALVGCLGAAGLGLPSAAAAAGTYYVDAASIGGPCSDDLRAEENGPDTPWCSLAKGLAETPAGATLQLRAGDHPFVDARDVRKADYVTVEPYPGETARIAGMDLSRVQHLAFERLAFTAGVIIRGGVDLRFVDNDLPLTPQGRRTSSGFIFSAVERVLVKGNHIADGWDGVNVVSSKPPSSDVVIWGNHFERLGNDGVHLNRFQTGVLVAANFFDECKPRSDMDRSAHGEAIQAMGPTEGVTAWSNTVLGGRGFLFMISPSDVGRPGYGHRGTVIENNVFSGRDWGVRTFSTPGAKFINNTIWNNTASATSGLDINDRTGRRSLSTTDVTLVNNLLRRLRVNPRVTFATRANNLVVRKAEAAAGDVVGTPEFESVSERRLRLRPGSPGVDAAARSWAPVMDVSGRLRDGRPDIGAYEASAAGAASADGYRRLPRNVVALLEGAGFADEVRADPEPRRG